MLTGQSTLDSAINAIKLGANDYLVKPIEMEQLILKIEKAACRKRRRDKLILEVYMTPYLTRREQKKQIAKILDLRQNAVKNSLTYRDKQVKLI